VSHTRSDRCLLLVNANRV